MYYRVVLLVSSGLKTTHKLGDLARQVGISAKKVLGLMVSSLFILIEGILLVVVGGLLLGMSNFFIPSLLVVIWAVWLIIFGGVLFVVPLLMVSGGVSMGLLVFLKNKTLRVLAKNLGKYGPWVNIFVTLFFTLILVTTGPLWLLSAFFATAMMNLLLWFLMKPIRAAIEESMERSLLPIL